MFGQFCTHVFVDLLAVLTKLNMNINTDRRLSGCPGLYPKCSFCKYEFCNWLLILVSLALDIGIEKIKSSCPNMLANS